MRNLLSLIFILISVAAHSQVRIYSNEFLNVGAGAQALALSNSVVASAQGGTSGYWNPAGLANMRFNYEVSAMHAEYFAGIAKYDFLSGAFKVNDSAAFAVTLLRFGVDDIPNTLDLVDQFGNVDYSRISTFSAADYALLLSYGKQSVVKGLQYGASVKLIYRKQGPFANAYGFGFDAGLKYQSGKWGFGANLRDATSTFNAWFFNTDQLQDAFAQTGNELPENGLEIALPKFLTGFGRYFTLGSKYGLMAEVGVDFTFDGKRNVLISSKSFSADPHAGFEFDYKRIVFLRGGVGQFVKIPDFGKEVFTFQPAVGLGIHLFNFTIDYALTDIGDQSAALYSNVFSLSYRFNALKK